MAHALVEVTAPDDWQAFHAIRRAELFEAKGRFGVYDDQHPDDRADFALPLLLKYDGVPVGVMRLDDFGNGGGAVRLVAITAGQQGRGHGKVMEALCCQRARTLGLHTLHVNAAPEAVGFYERTGWTRFPWNDAELVGIAASCIQMRKLL